MDWHPGTIVVGVDGSDLSRKAAERAAAMAKHWKAKLVIATVVREPEGWWGIGGAPPSPEALAHAIAQGQEEVLNKLEDELDLTGIEYETTQELGVHQDEPIHHRQSRAQGPGRIVLVCNGHSEYGHDGVAYELLDRPALRLDLSSHGVEVSRHGLMEVFRVEALSKSGRVCDVCKEDRDQLALDGRAPRFGQSRPAIGAEARPLRERRIADRAHGEPVATFRAEEGVVRVDVPARRTLHTPNLMAVIRSAARIGQVCG